mmetsp:Transcript_3315/g.12775  ORF Transcript_3315/g.12775 Transcript_3315/m.12775 type:complete len:207 (-) Transcript_3315:638-1258(-)
MEKEAGERTTGQGDSRQGQEGRHGAVHRGGSLSTTTTSEEKKKEEEVEQRRESLDDAETTSLDVCLRVDDGVDGVAADGHVVQHQGHDEPQARAVGVRVGEAQRDGVGDVVVRGRGELEALAAQVVVEARRVAARPAEKGHESRRRHVKCFPPALDREVRPGEGEVDGGGRQERRVHDGRHGERRGRAADRAARVRADVRPRRLLL